METHKIPKFPSENGTENEDKFNFSDKLHLLTESPWKIMNPRWKVWGQFILIP